VEAPALGSGDSQEFDDGYLNIGIGDIEEVDLKIDVPMGELIELVALEPTPSGKRPSDWTGCLAKLLIP